MSGSAARCLPACIFTSFLPSLHNYREINTRVERAVGGQGPNLFMVLTGCLEVYEYVYFIIPQLSRSQL